MSDNITIMGNIAAEPQRRQMGNGTAVTSFRVASSQRHFDKDRNGWVESGTNWYQVSAFRALGEHAFASLHKGDRVIVTGRLKLRRWENDQGKGLSVEIDADGIGHDLLWGTTQYRRTAGTGAWSISGSDGSGQQRDAGEAGWETAVPGAAAAEATSPESASIAMAPDAEAAPDAGASEGGADSGDGDSAHPRVRELADAPF
ncbi:single-stranded DNA-binding protein [Microbacterium terrisoli]|uniref:single-stranded DNA-binding protein n=1 Tax=Microbacterium terrisoli TaxID=3242192 RepID=UPI002803B8D5|nr:single-stranded DNA-binding protein [Microbacterium protaetiae]